MGRRIERAAHDHGHRLQKFWSDAADVQRRFAEAQKVGKLADDARAYAVDAQQRYALALDVLRERAEQDIAHEEAGTPPVLIYDYEVVLDGKSLPRPTNKMLLKILPPEGVEVKDWKRPYMIVDPRAGHGAGIGGFKSDSQVGVALRDGHPVYFVVFRPHPEPGQTLADVMRSRGRLRRQDPRAPSRRAQADHRRQLPGRLGEPDPRRHEPRHQRPAGGQRRAGRLLVRPPRREPDALQRRPARRRDAGAAFCPTSATASSTAPISSATSSSSIRAATTSASTTTCSPQPEEGAQELPRVREVVGRLPLHERAGDPLDRREPVRRQQARPPRGEPRARPPDRPQGDPHADHRVRLLGRQHHSAAAGAQLDRRHLRRRARDQDPRPAHHLHGARQGRPSRHLRLLLDRQEGARRGHLGDEDDRGAGAGPLRNDDRGPDRRRRRCPIHRELPRAQAHRHSRHRRERPHGRARLRRCPALLGTRRGNVRHLGPAARAVPGHAAGRADAQDDASGPPLAHGCSATPIP